MNDRPAIDSSRVPRASFQTTHWSVVRRAGTADPRGRAEALEQLCRAYWYPVYAEVRRRGRSHHDSQDLTQEFFACLLRRESFASPTPLKGRFRSFLLGALDYFLSDASAHAGAAKRGGGKTIVSFDEVEAETRYRLEPAAPGTPDQAFDRRWLLALIEAGLRRLEAEQAAAGKSAQFARLKPFLAATAEAGDYQRLGLELGLKAGAIAIAVHRLRQRCRDLIRDEVRQTVSDPAELEAELRYLFGG